jgi:Holliday junction resolvase RusA-like endonuclease|tara:strand:- start:853 stop:1260 length:408 start_codon:yes stop_codon:yes gene_type:complete
VRLVIVGDRKVLMKKNLMKVTRFGGLYKSGELKHFEAYVRMQAALACAEQGWLCTDGPVALSVAVVFGDRRKRDLQNCFGALCDALEGIVYDDDSQIRLIAARKEYVKGMWGFEINVEPYEGRKDAGQASQETAH